MRAKIRLVKTKDFLRTNAEGVLNLEESRQVLSQLSVLNTPDNLHDLLIDIRNAVSSLSLSDIYEIVHELSVKRESFRRQIAVLLGPKNDIDKARFMEMCANNRGFNVSIFDSFEDAIMWLMEDED